MTDKIQELELDVGQLKELILKAERPNLQMFLSNHLSALKTELERLKESIPKKIIVEKIPVQPVPAGKGTYYEPLTKYSWDQEVEKCRLYFDLPGVGVECKLNQVQFKFEKESVEFRLHGYKGLNYIFAIKRLHAAIDPSSCKYFLKNNHISVTLIKKDHSSWPQLAYKEDTFSKKEDEKKEAEDPQASIMNLMKKMYNEGDANMKKTIAEAWTKANDKKGSPKDFGQ